MAIITAQVLTACGVKPEEREARAKAALEKKYGREFEITEIYPQKFGELYYTVQAYALGEPDIRFTAYVDTEDDRVSDSYPERRVCAAIAEDVSRNLDGLMGYYYVFVHAVGPQPICDNPEISVKDYTELDPLNSFKSEIYLVPEGADAKNVYDRLVNMFSGMEYLNFEARLTILDEQLMSDIQEQLEMNQELNMDYKKLVQGCPFVEIPFVERKPAISEDEFIARLGGAL